MEVDETALRLLCRVGCGVAFAVCGLGDGEDLAAVLRLLEGGCLGVVTAAEVGIGGAALLGGLGVLATVAFCNFFEGVPTAFRLGVVRGLGATSDPVSDAVGL